jgi:hypothetical protein
VLHYRPNTFAQTFFSSLTIPLQPSGGPYIIGQIGCTWLVAALSISERAYFEEREFLIPHGG